MLKFYYVSNLANQLDYWNQSYNQQFAQLHMLCLAAKGLIQLDNSTTQSATTIKHLDVSINNLQKGVEFRPFTNLMTLIIDENQFKSLSDFPVFRDLQTFSANKNLFVDPNQFLSHANDKFGRLKNLSTLKNPMNPYFEGEQRYKVFKKAILTKFPALITLDGQALNETNKSQMNVGQNDLNKYEKIIGVITFDQKYAQQAVKSVKTRSQGNRFLKNHHL